MSPGPWLGARTLPGSRCEFRVWAPRVESVQVRLLTRPELMIPLVRSDAGYHASVAEGIEAGTRYLYRLGGSEERPDPCSRLQPEGVHGPSEVVDTRFEGEDTDWKGIPLRSYVLYELHVGTFTPEGTFDAIHARLDELRKLGITALELMPIAQFPGDRNWGYDGVYPFAVQNSYGGPAGLRRLVEACHAHDMAVVLDVVYNHLGPEGNYLDRFAPYFTDRYRIPWGRAINFDGPHSDEVRSYFIENALYWIRDLGIDALRLDAIHGIFDFSATPFLAQLEEAVQEYARASGRQVYLIAESDLNDSRVIRSREQGGMELDAQWSDDLHHALHVLLTGEKNGYYQDFGGVGFLAKALTEGFVYSGQYSPFRRCAHGNSAQGLPGDRFIVFAQNHDQIGNRLLGDRLSQTVSFEAQKLAAGVVLWSPYIPLLFMGEEYGETAPFPYFVSHSDPELIEAVRRGRREDFAAFGWKGAVPDAQDEATFQIAKIAFERRREGSHHVLLAFHEELLGLRQSLPALVHFGRDGLEVNAYETEGALTMRRTHGDSDVLVLYCFDKNPASVLLRIPTGTWHKKLDSADSTWNGPGTSVPQEFLSSGEMRIELPAESCQLFTRA